MVSPGHSSSIPENGLLTYSNCLSTPAALIKKIYIPINFDSFGRSVWCKIAFSENERELYDFYVQFCVMRQLFQRERENLMFQMIFNQLNFRLTEWDKWTLQKKHWPTTNSPSVHCSLGPSLMWFWDRNVLFIHSTV